MRRTPAAGFTLLEIAVALAILGVGIVTCLQVFSGSIRLQDRATRQSRAVLHARAAMDALLFQPNASKNSTLRPPRPGITSPKVTLVSPPDSSTAGVRTGSP